MWTTCCIFLALSDLRAVRRCALTAAMHLVCSSSLRVRKMAARLAVMGLMSPANQMPPVKRKYTWLGIPSYIRLARCTAFHLSICLSIYLPIYLPICLSIYLPICLSAYLSI